MTFTSATWRSSIDVLEDMLHEADVENERMFAIMINSAIEEAHSQLGIPRGRPHSFSAAKAAPSSIT
jgi:hypothetical protein